LPDLGTHRPPDVRARPSRLRLLFWLVLAILGFVGMVASSMIIRPSSVNLGHSSSQVRMSRDALLITSRERLAICVKAVAGASIDSTRARHVVESVLVELSQSARWSRTAYAKAPPVVDVDCAERPSILDPGVVVSMIGNDAIRLRDQPKTPDLFSKYRLIIYVVPESVIQHYFFGMSRSFDVRSRREGEEFMCTDHVCSEVTTGIYLTENEMINLRIARLVVEYTLGFTNVGHFLNVVSNRSTRCDLAI
jgi:hypothetical protein